VGGFFVPTDEEWKRIARYLRAQGETIEGIADVLDKPYTTVQRSVQDVTLLSESDNKNPNRKRAPGGGRKPKPKQDLKARDPELLAEIQRRKQNGEPVSQDRLKEQFGVSAGTVNSAQSFIEGMEQARTELAEVAPQCVCPNCGHQWVIE
jgi:DNA-binding transcriptional MerR regulator